MAFRTIEQKITAGNQFDGTAPPGTLIRLNDIEGYPAAANGGLIDFANPNPIQIQQTFIKLGGQASWHLDLIDADGIATPVLSGTVEAFVANTTMNLIILQGQKLKLFTVGATLAMVARITVKSNPK